MWWIKNPDRFKREVVAIDALRERQTWLSMATARLIKDGLQLYFDFDVVVNDETFPFTLKYPSYFPETPPIVIPRDGRRLSDHQYGDGGELCLEYRSDNWDPSVTGSMMIESTHQLLSQERPTRDERAVVPSAHYSSVGQRLRASSCRFLLTPAFLAYATGLPVGASRDATIIEIVAPKKIWTAYVASVGSTAEPDWRENEIPDRGRAGERGILLRVESLEGLPSDQQALQTFFAASILLNPTPTTADNDARHFIMIVDATSARMFYSFSKDGEPTIIRYSTVDFAHDPPGRLPESYGVLSQKKVGIVGCGSLGSKIAASLARSGVRAFVLVDDDIMMPGNLIRHELDADSLGAHKAEALEARLKALAVGVDISVRRVSLGGQEASGGTASALDELAGCDLIIDATADPQAFNFVASVARNALRPMLWAEVYAGGIGGFVARLRPGKEPPPHSARRQYLAWCRQQGVPWRGLDRDYSGSGSREEALTADDSDVMVIAAYTTRMATDALVRPSTSQFPHPAYVIGLSREWIFTEPFDTRAIDFVEDGHWRNLPAPEKMAEAIDLISSLIDKGGRVD
jgi:hypothetical protein